MANWKTSPGDNELLGSNNVATTVINRPQQGGDLDSPDDTGSSIPQTKTGFNTGTSQGGPQWQSAPIGSGSRSLGEFATAETAGDESAPTASESGAEATPHMEVGNAEGAEGSEEFTEATTEQLAAPEAGETAESDLKESITGYEGSEGAEFNFGGLSGIISSLFESSEGTELAEAGEAVEGQKEEFFAFLAPFIPLLTSTIGPALAKGVFNKLSKRTKRNIKRIAAKGIGIAGMVAKKLQEAAAEGEAAGEASGMELVDEGTVIETASQMESIFGADTRRQITNTTRRPWRHICALRIEFPSGKVYRGTGFFVGPRAVVTAGHCVYLHNQGGWARKVMVIPGSNGTSRPLGQATSNNLRSVSGWVTLKKPECDYGCVVLPAGTTFRSNPGAFGFAAFDSNMLLAKTAVLAGYPGDKPFAELWGDSRRLKAVTSKTLVYDIDTMGGQSGAPVYIKANGQRFAVGIHNYGGSTSNTATRVTQEVYSRLLAWSQIV